MMRTTWSELESWFTPDVSPALLQEVRSAIDSKTKPPGSLGVIELLAAQIAFLQSSTTPHIDPARIIVFAADHGISERGVSAFPAAVTAQMMANFSAGGAAVCVLAASNNIAVEVVDVGVNADLGNLHNIVQAKVNNATRDFLASEAMTETELIQALAAGEAAVQRAVAAGIRCIGIGEMGISNTTSAAAILSLLNSLPPTQSVGRGTGVDDLVLAHKISVVEQAINRYQNLQGDARAVLRAVGGYEIAAMVGACLAANRLNMPVVIDGFISSVAALVTCRLEPRSRKVMFFSHHSAEAGHTAVLTSLGARAMLNFDMRLGEGSAAALAIPLLRASAAMMRDMSTFEQAGVSNH